MHRQDSTLAFLAQENETVVSVVGRGEQKPVERLAAHRPNLHRETAALGYSVLPILPALGKFAVGVPKSAYGKAPGKLRDGYWFMRPSWNKLVATADDLEQWHVDGAGVGIRPDEDVLFIDSDCHPEDSHSAWIIDQCFVEAFGEGAPYRYGNGERRTYVLRLDTPRRSEELPYDGGTVELRSGTEQVVAHGTHPKTMQPYKWGVPLCAKADLPVATEARIVLFKELLATRLAGVKASTRSTAGKPIRDPETLKLDPRKLAVVVDAVDAIPNGGDTKRKQWIDTAHALKAAFTDFPGTGEECWERHSEKYPGHDANETTRVWNTMRPENGFRVGAQDLLRWADGGEFGSFSIRYWTDLLPDAEKPADTAAMIRPTAYTYTAPLQIPPRQWLYGLHYIRKFVSVTVAPGGTGKSSHAYVEAVAMATGRTLLHHRPNRRSKVWLFNGEDPIEEIQRRIAAILLTFNIDPSELEGWLFIDKWSQHASHVGQREP